jgi:DNA repair protein RecO (recombination protein O)
MPLIQDQAIVLRRLDYSETSQVLVLFTRDHGKVRAIAKGIKRSTKRRFATGIDLLEVGQVSLSTRTARPQALGPLTEWKPLRPLSGLREKLPRLYAAQYAAEVTAGLTEDWDPYPQVYDALLALLESLCDLDDPLPAVVAFVRGLLTEVGSVPQFDHCAGCGASSASSRPANTWYFSSHQGGLLCRDCEPAYVEKRQVPPAVLQALGNPAAAGTAADRGVFELLNYHLSHLMGRAPLLADKLAPRPKPQDDPAAQVTHQ